MEANLLNDEIDYIQPKKLEYPIRMTSASIRSPPLHHKKVKDGHVHFLPASMALGKAVIYFVKVKKKVEKKYVVLDTVHDKIFSATNLAPNQAQNTPQS